jgi:DNA invertase Pin-like site-specific DNA recombinase
MKAALYARISTDDHDQNINTQVQLLRKIAQERGYEIYREYLDEGWSGSDPGRPAMRQLRKDARARRFDLIMTQSDDRLWRDARQSLQFVYEVMELGIGIFLVNQGFDLSDPNGMTQYEISAVFSSHFRRQNSKKVKDGLARARAEGKSIGRPRAEFDISAAVAVLEAGGNKRRLAGDMRIAQSTLNKRLHEIGRSDLVSPDLKRKPVHARRGAENPPPENEREYISDRANGEIAQNTCFMQEGGA